MRRAPPRDPVPAPPPPFALLSAGRSPTPVARTQPSPGATGPPPGRSGRRSIPATAADRSSEPADPRPGSGRHGRLEPGAARAGPGWPKDRAQGRRRAPPSAGPPQRSNLSGESHPPSPFASGQRSRRWRRSGPASHGESVQLARIRKPVAEAPGLSGDAVGGRQLCDLELHPARGLGQYGVPPSQFLQPKRVLRDERLHANHCHDQRPNQGETRDQEGQAPRPRRSRRPDQPKTRAPALRAMVRMTSAPRGHAAAPDTRSAARRRALRARGFSAASCDEARIGFFESDNRFASEAMNRFTMRSSNEWYESTTRRPPTSRRLAA